MAITGGHVLLYTTKPEQLRAMLRDAFGFKHVDAGDGWLIFALPPAEVAVHPAPENGKREIYLMCDDVEALVGLYAGDGVFMRENLPAVAGTDALRAAYRDLFAALKVELSFKILEAEVAGDMAWLRGLSTGRIKVLASGAETADSFNQLIVLRRVGGAWKIRCYLYASDRPGTGTPR